MSSSSRYFVVVLTQTSCSSNADLGSPELDVVLAAVEQQQVLADLVKDECLTDGTPRGLQRPHMKYHHE